MRSPLRYFFGTLRSTLTWIVPAVAASLLGLYAVRACVGDSQVLKGSSEAAGNYLQTLGTIYAVLLAFVVFVVWQQFNEARANVEREANELLDLARTAKGLPDEIRRPLFEEVDRYVGLATGREWDAMATGEEGAFEEGARVLDRIWDLLVAYEPCSECHKSLYGEALARFNDLSDTRTVRISSALLRIPLSLRMLLYGGAAMTVTSMYLLEVASPTVHALMTAALAGAVSHLLYIVGDLDDSFAGDWQISREPFLRVRRYAVSAREAG
jgi:hypothetical protein